MTAKRFTVDKDGITIIDNWTDGLTECKYSQEAKLLCNFLNEVIDENEQLKQKIQKSIEMLKTEKETAISKNERIRLDFVITVLEDLKGDME